MSPPLFAKGGMIYTASQLLFYGCWLVRHLIELVANSHGSIVSDSRQIFTAPPAFRKFASSCQIQSNSHKLALRESEVIAVDARTLWLIGNRRLQLSPDFWIGFRRNFKNFGHCSIPPI
jgi:hypothetical protein